MIRDRVFGFSHHHMSLNMGKSERRKQTVVTVHGLNSDGQWQEAIDRALTPFFKCVAIRYPHYRRFGVTKLFSDPYLLVAAASLIGALCWFEAIGLRGAIILSIATLIVGYAIAYRRRRAALETVRAQLSDTQLVGERPNAIAHSLGSYLLCTAMKRWVEIRFRRIILSGCVVSRTFNWEGHRRGNESSFDSVRNEMGNDGVARAAVYLQGLVPGLGHAGSRGFIGAESFVHTTLSPNATCVMCSSVVGRVHNVMHGDLGHNDPFVAAQQRAETLWLPVLWGIEPVEYQNFLELCAEIRTADDSGDAPRLIDELRTRQWSWLRGESLDAYNRTRIRAMLGKAQVEISDHRLAELVDTAAMTLWRDVERAKQARLNGSKEERQIAALYPKWAVGRAIDITVKETREWKKRSSYR
jgi:hypothetical protein